MLVGAAQSTPANNNVLMIAFDAKEVRCYCACGWSYVDTHGHAVYNWVHPFKSGVYSCSKCFSKELCQCGCIQAWDAEVARIRGGGATTTTSTNPTKCPQCGAPWIPGANNAQCACWLKTAKCASCTRPIVMLGSVVMKNGKPAYLCVPCATAARQANRGNTPAKALTPFTTHPINGCPHGGASVAANATCQCGWVAMTTVVHETPLKPGSPKGRCCQPTPEKVEGRTWYCSLREGHDDNHRAFKFHNDTCGTVCEWS